MIREKLMMPALNCEIPTILANGIDSKLWMVCNPAKGTMRYVVMRNGKSVFEGEDIEAARKFYNNLGNERIVA